MRARKIVATLLAAGVATSMLAGCGGSQGKTKGTSSGDYKEHLTISIAHWSIGQAITGKSDPILDQIYKKFNITIEPKNITWDDYKTKINTWAAAGTLPDVFSDDAFQETNFSKWVSQGVVKALPSDLSAYPNIKKYMAQSDVQGFKYPLGSKSAKFYCVPRASYDNINMWANDNAVMIRKDWMEKVGITKMPENMDEFTALMKAFVEKDPDGNGKNDTIGLTAYNASWLAFFLQCYEPALNANNSWTKDSGGKWIPGFMTDKAVEGVTALKKLFDAGGLDKDIASIKGNQGRDKFTSGVAGAYAHSGYPTTLNGFNTDMQKRYGNDFKWTDHVALLKPFKSSDGNYYRRISVTPWSETYFSSQCSDAKMARTLALLDWGFTTDSEGFKLVRYGIEGQDYTEADGKVTRIDSKDAQGNTITLAKKYPSVALANWWGWFQGFSYTDTSTQTPDIQKQSKDMLDWEIKNAKPTPTNLQLGFLNYDGKDKETFNLSDEISKALLSKDASAEWKQMVADYKKNGYDTAIANLNEAAKKAGITGYTTK